MTNRRAEHELLICIARKSLDEGVKARLRDLVQRDIDWSYLFQSASVHGLLPLLATHLLATVRPLLSEPALQQLRADCLNGSKSNIYLLRELLRVVELFNAESIRVLAFKGPVLGEMIYGDVGLRQAGDLDILIAKEDFHRAKYLLQSHSYLMEPQLTAAQQKSHLGFHCEIQFLNQDQFSVVDLHWGLTPKTFPFFLGFEDLWARRKTSRIAGHAIETFCNEDLLLYLCVHGAKHYWSRLEWIAAVAELVRSPKAIDWADVTQRARETNSERILSVGLLLASKLFALELPKEVTQSLKGFESMTECALGLEQKLFQDTAVHSTQIEMFRWNLRFMDRKLDAVTSLLRSVFVPTISDWRAVKLPDSVYPLYYGYRALRLVSKYGHRSVQLL